MKELTEEQKEKIKDVYNKLSKEKRLEFENAFKELGDEELNQISGGYLLDWVKEGVGAVFDWMADAYFSVAPNVQGPKTNMEQCQFCGAPIPGPNMKEHLINNHKEELAELIRQSDIF